MDVDAADETIILRLGEQDAEAMRALLVRTVKDLEWEARDGDWHPQTRAAIGADAARFRAILDRLHRGMGRAAREEAREAQEGAGGVNRR